MGINKFYRESAGAIWAFAEDGSQDEFITETMVALTAEEIELHLNPPPTTAQLAEIESSWRATQMPIARENVTAIEFGDDSIPGTAADWKAYWLALRAWIDGADGYPDSTHRPVEPT